MRISELMLRDIRAEIDYEDEKIIIKNPKGEVRQKLLDFFDNQLMLSTEKESLSTDVENLEMLIKNLTNIEIDTEDIEKILCSPCAELNRVIFYLSSIMQELVFEVLALKNLEMRLAENTILEKDTLTSIGKAEALIKEMEQRMYLRVDNVEIDKEEDKDASIQ